MHMKKLVRLLGAATLLTAALTATACAADFTSAADSLHDMGLFQGNASGYDLDRAPRRDEAAVMLVRLLGAETKAQSMEYTAPFTDVADWAKPYVNYLYVNGLTNGVSPARYDPAAACGTQSYATFLLRALGYNDITGTDFTYATALDFAEEKGVVDVINSPADGAAFLRDHMVAMSYTALACPTADGKYDTLLDSLVDSGAVTAQAAKPTQTAFAAADVLAASSQQLNSQPYAAKMTMKTNTAIANSAQRETSTSDVTMTLAIIPDAAHMDASKLSTSLTTITDGETLKSNVYYTNGVCYYKDETGVKYKMALSFDDVLSTISDGADLSSYVDAVPVTAITGVTSSVSGGKTTYSLRYSDGYFAYYHRMADAIAKDSGLAMTMDIKSLSLSVTLDASGSVASQHVDMATATVLEDSAENGGRTTVDLDAAMDITITAAGSSVRVDLPGDLSSYPDLDVYLDEA